MRRGRRGRRGRWISARDCRCRWFGSVMCIHVVDSVCNIMSSRSTKREGVRLFRARGVVGWCFHEKGSAFLTRLRFAASLAHSRHWGNTLYSQIYLLQDPRGVFTKEIRVTSSSCPSSSCFRSSSLMLLTFIPADFEGRAPGLKVSVLNIQIAVRTFDSPFPAHDSSESSS